MLNITIQDTQLWDEEKEEFINVKGQTLQLEHSLLSLSKWESKWCKPFITEKNKTFEETMDYVKCMTLKPNVDDNVYKCLTAENIAAIDQYINHPATATTFSNNIKGSGKSSKEILTAELIYYLMVTFNIPFECQKWHLNRLITLIKICEIKNQPPSKMSKGDVLRNQAAINAARRKQLNSKG